MSTDDYMVVWVPVSRRYTVRHVNMRNGRELRWDRRDTTDYGAFREARSAGYEQPDVIMATIAGYAAATKAIGNYPSQGPYV